MFSERQYLHETGDELLFTTNMKLLIFSVFFFFLFNVSANILRVNLQCNLVFSCGLPVHICIKDIESQDKLSNEHSEGLAVFICCFFLFVCLFVCCLSENETESFVTIPQEDVQSIVKYWCKM